MPCKNCAIVMFCSASCHDIGHEKFHGMECGVPEIHYEWVAGRRLVMQTVTKALKVFPNLESLVDVVGKFLNRNPNKRQNYAVPSIRAYMQFFGLVRSVEGNPSMQNPMFIGYTNSIHSIIAASPEFKSMFRSIEAKRFLAHLILHHFYIVDAFGFNAISLLNRTFTNELGSESENLSGFAYAHGIYLNSSHLNHSCQPNIDRIYMGTKLVCKVIRPIKSGEQLFVSYL